MKKVGEVFERDGKRYVVTYVAGDNYSYAPVKDSITPVPAAKEEPEPVEEQEKPVEETVIKTRRRGRKVTA